MRWLVLLGACAGCLRADVIECGDVVCPADSLCLADEHRCVSPTQLDVTTAKLELTDIDCGTTRTVQVPLRNHSDAPISFTARSTVQGIVASPSEGVVMPGASVDLEVVADPGESSIPGFVVDGDLEISTSESTHTIDIQMSSRGAIANIEGALAFGAVPVDQVKSAKLVIKNAGNAPMSATLSTLSAPFSLLTTGTHEIEPRGDAQFNAQFLPHALATFNATAELTLEGNFCRPVPFSLPVTGRSSGEPLLVGIETATFPTTACSAPPADIVVDLFNPLLDAQDVTLTISDPSMFSVPASITIPPISEASFRITRRATTTAELVGLHEATLVIAGAIQVSVPVSQAIVAPVLHVDKTGASLTSAMPSITIMVSNTGNTAAAVKVEPPTFTSGGTAAQASPSALQIPEQGVLPITVSRNSPPPSKVVRDPAEAMFEVAATADALLIQHPAPPYPIYKAGLTSPGACSDTIQLTFPLP